MNSHRFWFKIMDFVTSYLLIRIFSRYSSSCFRFNAYLHLVARPPRICLSCLFCSKIFFTCVYNSGWIRSSRSLTSLCTVLLDTPNHSAAARTVAFWRTIYSPRITARTLGCSFMLPHFSCIAYRTIQIYSDIATSIWCTICDKKGVRTFGKNWRKSIVFLSSQFTDSAKSITSFYTIRIDKFYKICYNKRRNTTKKDGETDACYRFNQA